MLEQPVNPANINSISPIYSSPTKGNMKTYDEKMYTSPNKMNIIEPASTAYSSPEKNLISTRPEGPKIIEPIPASTFNKKATSYNTYYQPFNQPTNYKRGDNMRITLEEKFKDVLNQKAEKLIPKNMGMSVANTNINISTNSKPQLPENQNIHTKVSRPKSYISEVSDVGSNKSFATEKSKGKEREYELLCPPCLNKDLMKYNLHKGMRKNTAENTKKMNELRHSFVNLANQNKIELKPKDELIGNLKTTLETRASVNAKPINSIITNGYFTDYQFHNARERTKMNEQFAEKADYTFEKVKYPTDWSQNSLDIRDHFADINLLKKNQDELRMQALQRQDKDKTDRMNDIMLEKLNNHNEKLKGEFEKEREKLHKETQKNQFNAHLQKDAEIKSIQKAIEKKQMNEENDSMAKSIHEYNELLKKMEKFAKDEKMRFTLANQKQVQNSKIKPKFNDVIVLPPENRPKLTYESEKMGKCDNCFQEYPLKRLTKSPKRK